MSGAVTRLATYEDLLGLPEDVRAEVLNGAIVTAPTPLLKHSNAQRALGRFIGGPFHDDDGRGGPGGWWIFVEVDVQLGVHNVVRPDLARWRRERLPNPGEVRPIEAVCEVLSPSTAARDRVVKRNLYAECGVPNYWLVDADARLLEAFVLQDGRWTLTDTYDEGACARTPPFEDVELEVGRLLLPKS